MSALPATRVCVVRTVWRHWVDTLLQAVTAKRFNLAARGLPSVSEKGDPWNGRVVVETAKTPLVVAQSQQCVCVLSQIQESPTDYQADRECPDQPFALSFLQIIFA